MDRPPLLEEVIEYCKGKRTNARAFFDYYHENGWTANGEPVKNWKLLVDAWEKKKNRFDFKEQRSFSKDEERALLLRTSKSVEAWCNEQGFTSVAEACEYHDKKYKGAV